MAQTKKGAVADQKPKRPLSGYMRFCQEKRAEVKTANPSKKVGYLVRNRHGSQGDPL